MATQDDVRRIALGLRDTAEDLLASEPEVLFTEPHDDGYRAMLVRLAAIEVGELEELLIDAWRCQASPTQVKTFDGTGGG